MRIQVNLNDDMVNRVDNLAKKYGVTRSSLCSLFIGQMVTNTESSFKLAENVMSSNEFLQKAFKDN